MTRILWHGGAPWTASGYGQQTAIFAPRLRDLGHDVAISAWWGLTGAGQNWEGMDVYPGDQRYGNVMLPTWAEMHDAELVIALLDAWVLIPEAMRSLPLAVWTPVDHQPCPPAVAEFFRRSGARTIAMSRFGERMLQDEGLDPLYVPHGIDTNVFQPRFRDEVREMLGVKDGFLIGMVANNAGGTPPAGGPARKAFSEVLQAFAIFQKTHTDAVLYMHTEMSGRPGLDNGVNIPLLIDRHKIPDGSIKATDRATIELGMHPGRLAALYSAMDILVNPSYGEGFGIPIVESQACGTPVIVTDWTSMPELCGAGWRVGGELWDDTAHGSTAYMRPNVAAIVAALEDAYDKAAGLRAQAEEFAQQYDADLVTKEYWVPALEALSKPREVPPLPNRKHRRAAKKVTA